MISQREAKRLRKRVAQLESILDAQKRRWNNEWPGSTVIHRLPTDAVSLAIVATARALSHAVVVTTEDNKLKFWGIGL